MFKLNNINSGEQKPFWIYYLVVLIISIVPLFYNLGGPVLNLWDESRRAVNAYEMLESGNLLVTQFNGEPEMWGTKPPLLIWAQTLSMKIFGTNEWALRFPSAFAGLLLGFLLLWFSKQYFKSYTPGLIAVLILYTSKGFISAHSVRTGDFDAILVLFTTAATFCLFLGTETSDRSKKGRFILAFFLLITMAAMTKGIAAFIMGPAYLIYLIFRKDLLNWLKNRNFWIGNAVLVLVFGGFYMLRNHFNPGYLQAVIENEVTGRYMEGLEENKEPFTFYFRLLYQLRFQNWYYLIPVGLLLGYFSKDAKIKRLLNYLILVTIGYLVVISISETKLQWYDLPVFPYISIMAAVFFYVLFRLIKSSELFNRGILKSVTPALIIIFFVAAPYFNIYKQNKAEHLPHQDPQIHNIGHFLRDVEKGREEVPQSFTILYSGEFQHFLFYVYQLEEKGYEINLQEDPILQAGEDYLIYQKEVLEGLGPVNDQVREKLSEGIYLLKTQD